MKVFFVESFLPLDFLTNIIVPFTFIPFDFVSSFSSVRVLGFPLEKSFIRARFIYPQEPPRDGTQKGAVAFISSRTM